MKIKITILSKILVLVILFSTVTAISQEDEKFEASVSLSFPETYFGIYEGDLYITSQNGTTNIPMEFHLLPIEGEKDKYQYTIVYITNEIRQERQYTLITKDAEKGVYTIDENNGILLDAKVWTNKLYSMFEVQGSLLTTQLTFEADHMIFEITFSRKEVANKSGTTDEKPIEVLSYPITTVQKGVLKKQ